MKAPRQVQYFSLHDSTVQCSSVQCSAVHCSAVQGSAVQGRAEQCSVECPGAPDLVQCPLVYSLKAVGGVTGRLPADEQKVASNTNASKFIYVIFFFEGGRRGGIFWPKSQEKNE